MAKIRRVVLPMEFDVSKKAGNTCGHNRKHPVPRGTAWLAVSDGGSPGTTKRYCVPCAHEMLQQAQEILSDLLSEVQQHLPEDGQTHPVITPPDRSCP